MIENSDLLGKHQMNFEYVLVSLREIEDEFIKNTNTLIDNIFLADKIKEEEYLEKVTDMIGRIKQLTDEDCNQWITWLTKDSRLSEEDKTRIRGKVKEGGQEMSTVFARVVDKKYEEGREEGREEGTMNAVDNLMKKLNYTAEEACDIIGISYEDYLKKKKQNV